MARTDTVTLDCDNGHTYRAAVIGSGEFTPAHDLDGSATLVPTAFGPVVATWTDAGGTVLGTFVDPPSAKGGQTGKTRATSTSCDFLLVEFEDPELGLLTITVVGTVTGFVTPVV